MKVDTVRAILSRESDRAENSPQRRITNTSACVIFSLLTQDQAKQLKALISLSYSSMTTAELIAFARWVTQVRHAQTSQNWQSSCQKMLNLLEQAHQVQSTAERLKQILLAFLQAEASVTAPVY